MKSTLSLLLVLLTQFFMPRHNAQLRLLKAQITILRARIPTQRIILSSAEKAELMRIGAECRHDIDGLLEVAMPATYRRWLAWMRSGRLFTHSLTDQLRLDLLELFEERYQCRSTIITAQLPVTGWHQMIGEPTIADAILDRIVHNAHRIKLKGDGMRRKSISTRLTHAENNEIITNED